MQHGQGLVCLLIFTIICKYSFCFEIFINKTENIEYLTSFQNKSYEIPLFETRYITIRIYSNDLRRDKYNNTNVIGYKFQVKTNKSDIINIEKKEFLSTRLTRINNLETILSEDLYIIRRENSLAHIFNAYPSPTLIDLNKNFTNNSTIDTIWSIDGIGMGITHLTFCLDVFYDDDTSFVHIWSFNILVTQPKRRIDTIFYITIPFIVLVISIIMGIILDTTVLIEIVKKPTPVLVGFIAQYGLMPFLAMSIAKLFHYTPLNSLALFVIGCCPGSGASNQWTIIFDGDVNLSAIMSLVSTAASFVMMPLYLYTIGRFYMNELSIRVPFLALLRSLALVVVPYGIGIVISHFFPKTRPFVEKLIKPIMICIVLFFLTFGLVVNWYLFKTIDLYTALTAPLLPFLGFIFGALLALISRMSWKHVKTIGIEAGIQNTGIAFMIIMYSFPQPYATQAIIVPMVVALLTTKPFWIILIVRNQIRKYKKRKESNLDGKLFLTNDKTSINNEQTTQKDTNVENMQKL